MEPAAGPVRSFDEGRRLEHAGPCLGLELDGRERAVLRSHPLDDVGLRSGHGALTVRDRSGPAYPPVCAIVGVPASAATLSGGEVAERLKAALLKSAKSKDFVGSNPTLSATP